MSNKILLLILLVTGATLSVADDDDSCITPVICNGQAQWIKNSNLKNIFPKMNDVCQKEIQKVQDKFQTEAKELGNQLNELQQILADKLRTTSSTDVTNETNTPITPSTGTTDVTTETNTLITPSTGTTDVTTETNAPITPSTGTTDVTTEANAPITPSTGTTDITTETNTPITPSTGTTDVTTETNTPITPSTGTTDVTTETNTPITPSTGTTDATTETNALITHSTGTTDATTETNTPITPSTGTTGNDITSSTGTTSTDASNHEQYAVLFVVDGSGSIGKVNFNLVRQWLVDVSAALLETQNTVRRIFIEILQYSQSDSSSPDIKIDIADSTVFEIPFKFGECENITCITTGVNSMRYLSAQTFTYYALRRAREVELKNPVVENATKIIVVLTDGDATDGENLPTWHNASVADGITTYAVGVGYNTQLSELLIIANGGSSDERVFTTDGFDGLSNITSILTNQLLNITA